MKFFRYLLESLRWRRRGKCSHLHLTAEGYCPMCNRFFDGDVESETKAFGFRR
jgi:uncharacterized OB-fold protein